MAQVFYQAADWKVHMEKQKRLRKMRGSIYEGVGLCLGLAPAAANPVTNLVIESVDLTMDRVRIHVALNKWAAPDRLATRFDFAFFNSGI